MLSRDQTIDNSVPAFHAGAHVAVEAFGGTIRIRTGSLILAEHPRCLIRAARVEDPTMSKSVGISQCLPLSRPRSVLLS